MNKRRLRRATVALVAATALLTPSTAAAATESPAQGLVADERAVRSRPSATGPGTAITASSAPRPRSMPTTRRGSAASSISAPPCASRATTSCRSLTRRSYVPEQITVSTWFRGESTPGRNRYIVAKGSDRCEASAYALYSSSKTEGLGFYVYDGEVWKRSPEALPTVWDGKWHHAAGTYDGQFVRLFVDGVEVGTGTPTDIEINYDLPSTETVFGAYMGRCTTFLVGDVDEVEHLESRPAGRRHRARRTLDLRWPLEPQCMGAPPSAAPPQLGCAAACPSRCSTPRRRSRRCGPSWMPDRRRPRPRRYILGPEVAAFEAEFAAYLGASHAIGVANGTDAITLALRALGVGPGRRGRRARRSRSTPPPRRSRRPARARCSATSTPRRSASPRRRCARRSRRAPRRSSPCTCSATSRRSRRSRRSASPSSRTPPRPRARGLARPPRRARHDRHVLVLPVQEPRRLRRRRRGHDRTTTRSPSASGCCASTARATRSTFELVGHNSPARRAPGRRSCACSCRTSTRWCDGRRAAARRLRGSRPRRARRAAAAARAGADPAWHLYVVRHERGRRARRGARRRRDRPQGLLPRAGPPPAGDARVGSRRRAPGHRGARAARTSRFP